MRNVYFTSLLMLCMSVHVKAGDWMKRLPDNLLYPKFLYPERMMPLRGMGLLWLPILNVKI